MRISIRQILLAALALPLLAVVPSAHTQQSVFVQGTKKPAKSAPAKKPAQKKTTGKAPAKAPTSKATTTFGVPKDRLLAPWPASKVVAKVNGEAITGADVAQFIWEWRGNDVINTLMIFKLIDQEAKKRGVVVIDAEVKKMMNEQLKDLKSRMPKGHTLDQELMALNNSWSRVYVQLRATLQLDKITEKGLKKSDLIQSAQIVVRVPGNTPEEQAKNKEATLEAANKIVAEIRGGMKWDDAVQKYSEDPFTKGKGGDLGWKWRDELDPKFAEAVFKLKPGDIADAVETPGGYQIIRATKFGTGATPAEYQAATKRITDMRRSMLVRELQEKAKMENFIVPIIPPSAMPKQTQPGEPQGGD